MQKRLQETHPLYDEPATDELKVAVTTMAFKNGKIINLLRERGTYIKTEQWGKQREVEERIN